MNIEILLDPWTVAPCFLVGAFLGYLLRRLGHEFISTHIYWMLAGGMIFFVPIMVDNIAHGTLATTRTLGLFGLWIIFSVGMTIGSKIRGLTIPNRTR